MHVVAVTAMYGWPDWLNLAANVSAAVIALGGFWIAILELRKTRGAAESTRSLTLAQNLRNVKRDLDESLPNARRNAIRALNDWRSLSVEVHGILEKSKAPKELLSAVNKSRQLAVEAKDDLQTQPKVTVLNATQKARGAIALVADDVSQFLAALN